MPSESRTAELRRIRQLSTLAVALLGGLVYAVVETAPEYDSLADLIGFVGLVVFVAGAAVFAVGLLQAFLADVPGADRSAESG